MLFVFEGPDNAGKSTVIRNIQTKLTEYNKTFTSIKEPSDNNFGSVVRNIHKTHSNLTDDLELSILALHTMDRHELLLEDNLYNSILQNEEIVLADRSLISTLAYQILPTKFDDPDSILRTFIHSHNSLLRNVPDRIYYLRVPPKHIFDESNSHDLYEKFHKQKEVREAYDYIFKYSDNRVLYEKYPILDLLEQYVSTCLTIDTTYMNYEDVEDIIFSDLLTFI